MPFDGIARLFNQLSLSGATMEFLENEELLMAHGLEKPRASNSERYCTKKSCQILGDQFRYLWLLLNGNCFSKNSCQNKNMR